MLKCFAVNCRHNKNQECHGKEFADPGGEKPGQDIVHMAMHCTGFECCDHNS